MSLVEDGGIPVLVPQTHCELPPRMEAHDLEHVANQSNSIAPNLHLLDHVSAIHVAQSNNVKNDRAFYRIQIQGHLSTSWSDRLGGMTIQPSTVAPDSITTLTGELPDQAALRGVINSLLDLQCSVLAVHRLPLTEDSDPDSPAKKKE